MIDWADLYDRTYASVYKIAYCRTHHVQQAEDIAHDVYVKAMVAERRGKGSSGDPVHWIRRIARNMAIDDYRYERHRVYRPLHSMAETQDDAASPHEMAERAFFWREMERLLPADQLEVVKLDLEGLRDAEIANVLGMTEGAAKIRLHRGRSKLIHRFRQQV